MRIVHVLVESKNGSKVMKNKTINDAEDISDRRTICATLNLDCVPKKNEHIQVDANQAKKKPNWDKFDIELYKNITRDKLQCLLERDGADLP